MRLTTSKHELSMSIFIFLASILARAVASPSIRILPLGDALTIGNDISHGAHRKMLTEKLSFIGYNADILGTADVSNYERYQQTIVQTSDTIEELLDKTDPDVILLLIGIDDIGNGDNAETAIYRWDELIGKISELRPFMHIIASNLPSSGNAYYNHDIKKHFNPYTADIIKSHVRAGRRVTFVDMNSVLNPYDTKGNLRPSEENNNPIHKAWTRKIEEVLSPSGDKYNPGILRIRGSVDSNHLVVTFTREISDKEVRVINFDITGLEVLSIELDVGGRDAVLTTTKQTLGHPYEVTITGAVSSKPNYVSDTESIVKTFRAGWRFLNLADWHQGEKYILESDEKQMDNDVNIVKLLRREYGGDLIMVPGDTNAGFWDRWSFKKKLEEKLGVDLEQKDAVTEAGNRCYSGVRNTFSKGGYWKQLYAFGDHEAGDNSWRVNSTKSRLQPQFRETFSRNFNYNSYGKFRFTDSILNVTSRPVGTQFEDSSYALIHKNTLIVTIDVLYQESPWERIGPAGTVSGQVNGEHLKWFDAVLSAGGKHPDVDHIVVQGHFPVLYPVRKSKSSGMYMDSNDDSAFWKTMRKHNVDIYFSGETHLNTVTKDPKSDLIQIVSRGNFFSNFLSVDISNDTISVTCHNEIGQQPVMYNYEYEVSGRFVIKKSGSGTTFESEGALAFLDRQQPMIHFAFERIVPLNSRPVIGLGENKNAGRFPIVESVTVGGIQCSESIPNLGAFGKDYDAQTANVALVEGVNGLGAEFDENSRAALWSMGPHSGTNVISFAMWFQTQASSKMIMLSYESCWTKATAMNLIMNRGKPEIVYSKTDKLSIKGSSQTLYNDGKWHHIAVSMPRSQITLSELQIFIDGNEVCMDVVGIDKKIVFNNGGMLGLGGAGHSGTCNNSSDVKKVGFRSGVSFRGKMDDVFVWSHSLPFERIEQLSRRHGIFTIRSRKSLQRNDGFCISASIKLKECNKSKWQQWQFDSNGYMHHGINYDMCLTVDGEKVVLKYCDSVEYDFKWKISPDGAIYLLSNHLLVMTTRGQEIFLEDIDDSIEQKWDIINDEKSDPEVIVDKGICKDRKGNFIAANNRRNCKKPRKHSHVCWRDVYKKNCPVACEMCR